MIARQAINGRQATVAFIGPGFEPTDEDHATYAKLLFDDGEMILLDMGDGSAEGDAESAGYAKQRMKYSQPFDQGAAEMDGFAKSRERHRRPISLTVDAPEVPHVDTTKPPTTPVETNQSVEHQLAAWAKAVQILDASEVFVRDVIERELVNVKIDRSNDNVNKVVDTIMESITEVRTEAIRTAFLLVRSRLGDKPIADVSLSRWAATFLRADLQNIEMAIRAGIVDGLDGAEVARKVVGSMGLNGVDGVTEFTRLKVAHLGRAAIRASAYHKQGVAIP